MAEPLNLNLVISQTNFVSSTRYLTALAFQGTNTAISSGYLLRWNTPLINTTGYTLSVAYISGSGDTFVASACSVFVAYNTTNLFSSTPTEYFLINTLNPLTTNITSNINGSSIKNINTFSQTSTSVQVEFFPNFDTTNNYAPTNFEISAVAFDNEPFIRSLTAVIIQDTGGTAGKVVAQGQTPFKWVFPTSNVWAQKPNGTIYISNTVEPISSINTLIFYLTADTYDFRTANYTLCTTNLTAINDALLNTDTYQVIYDTFPSIDLNVFINYENTNFTTQFYRLISPTPLTASPEFVPNFIRLSSIDVDLTTNLIGDSYNAWYTTNSSQTQIQVLSTVTHFNRSVPGVSSIQGYLSAFNLNNSLSSWYSPHILQRSLSSIFVPYFLEGDFIGVPKAYFKIPILSPVKYELLTNLSDTPGIRFYGEGHTETIFLSAQNIHPLATGFIWSIDNKIQNSQFPSLTNISVSVTSQPGFNTRLPISLQITNNLFLSSSPIYYFDDTTGIKTPYPYYITTVDLFGNELLTNTKFKESIHILPYPPLNFEFSPGIDSTIFLPANGSIVSYQASLRTSIDANTLSKCYGKYGLLWDWQTYTGCATNPDSFTGKPSSWETTSCNGLFPKQWTLTDKLSTDLFNTNPVKCTTSNITWTISSVPSFEVESFFNQFTGPVIDNEIFCYDLSLRNIGGDILPGINNCNGLHYTASTTENTNIVLNVKQPVTCLISAEQLPVGYTNDWLPREIIVDETKSILSITSPVIKIYTPNRYVLTGTNIFFENLITNINTVTSIFIDFDDNKTIFLTGSDVKNSFNISYENVGSKTLLITVNTDYTSTPITTTFANIVNVVAEYDEVFPTEYRSTETSIELPWPNIPKIGSNDWVVEDNINNWFIKFQDNLNYLESRARVYPGTFTEYFGYFGVQPAPGPVSACIPWTWEDLDCFNTSLPYEVTWRDVLSAEDSFDQDGLFVQRGCGTWQTSECSFSAINPTCYGLYDVNWSWRQRKKRSSLKPIKWKETKLNNIYQKRWYSEITDFQFLIVCDKSLWNVNIPNLDSYYEIVYPFVQPRCIYYGIASKNNKLYIAQKTAIKLFDSNQAANFLDYEDTTDGVVRFSNIKNICLDSAEKIYILDNILSKVSVYTYKRETPGDDFKPFIEWGGFGTAASQYKFLSPNDIHIDQLDNVWVTDTGNGCVKHYSNTGTWLKTIIDDNLKQNIPLSTAVDSQNNVHILTKTDIRVYNYNGEYLFSYSYKEQSSAEPRRINTSYNREVIYLALDTQVLKYFRNGVFFGYIIDEKENVFNITSIYQDEFRNLLITTNDKILKYPDLMSIKRLKGTLPITYWSIEDILIHKEEYVQSWVYTKAFQRMWDNIEIFRNTLLFENTNVCKSYKPPLHEKDKMIIGQNEIVTSTAVNRVLSYLWDNFTSLLDYFDPNCEEPL